MNNQQPSKPTEQWLASFRRGDHHILESIYLEQAPRVRGMLQSGFSFTRQDGSVGRFWGIKSAFDLDCAIQDIFCRAFEFRTRESYDGRVPFGVYLNAIARNFALNTLRRREDPQDELVMESTINRNEKCEPLTSPEGSAMHHELSGVVSAFKAQCDAEQLAILQCRYVDGLSQADAAKHLGKTRRRIRTIEAKLRKQLVKLLEDHR